MQCSYAVSKPNDTQPTQHTDANMRLSAEHGQLKTCAAHTSASCWASIGLISVLFAFTATEVVWSSSVVCSLSNTGADVKRRLGSLQGKGGMAAPAAASCVGGRGALAVGKGRGAQPFDLANAALQTTVRAMHGTVQQVNVLGWIAQSQEDPLGFSLRQIAEIWQQQHASMVSDQ